eukprot:gene14173-19018_t
MEKQNPSIPNVLVCGGAGYIGTHTIVCLLQAGYYVTVIDCMVNSNPESLNRVRSITKCGDRLVFHNLDLCNENALENIFQNSPTFHSCIHFAGLKAVGESVRLPLLYYKNNIGCTINLLNMLDKYNCKSFVFSSSATVYGSAPVPITEDTPTGTGITNAYGRTKFMIEEILKDFKRAKDLETTSNPWSIVTLRYFNPIGSHPSGLIGEDPNGVPNNLMPFVAQVAVGRREKLTIFGNDYPTKDGTGVRDYIHVTDLALGHLAALNYVESPHNKFESIIMPESFVTKQSKGYGSYSVYNLGTGVGYSVLDMVEAMKIASGKPLPYEFGPRREGDIATCYADPSKAKEELGWIASRNLDEMCVDLWKWQINNPNGYST